MSAFMGRIFAIKKYAIHDGPDIRTTVFFKGCPLSCHWCHNPEGLNNKIELIWLADRCVGCKECIDICHHGALSSGDKGILRDMEICTGCGSCAVNCPAIAHQSTGWEASVDEIMDEIKKDIPFYDQSGGGVTFSGGEPLMQPEFLLELLHRCGELEIHRAVDTSAYASTDLLLTIAQETDLFLIDIKHMESSKHLEFTGVKNEAILANIEALAAAGKEMTIRVPLIEGINTDAANLIGSADFIVSLESVSQVDLLPYHSIAGAKYRKLDLHNPGVHFRPLDKEKIEQCVSYFTERGLNVQVGG